MINPWRTALQAEIRRRYIHKESAEWYDLTVSPSGLVNLAIVSDRFIGITYPERTAQVQALIREHYAPAEIGFLTLYTIDEARTLDMTPPPPAVDTAPVTWHDLALRAANQSSVPLQRSRPAGRARTIAFYSFKGGVGRTTALIHVAATLARLGRKVVAVDLDLEAPGLGSAVTLREPRPSRGIVDFFYDRLYRPSGEAPTVEVSSVVGEVELQAPGRFLVVPAGELSLDYVAKLDDLRAAATTRQGDDLWAAFARDLTRHVEPDVILVDSRTGINQWGALSLLRAADELVAFLYPNDQNRQGISLLLQSLAGLGTPTHVVFSPVPATDGPGLDRVRDQWRSLQHQLKGVTD
ncbi:MAG TPA: AAA family ATPase, partial [Symbiobacteriaceae bacterium]|nr:AAA family ATPase [Symbiobacteriaceae bacterium]